MDKKRAAELIELASRHLNDNEWFDYHSWDGLIECDETMTAEELEWLAENVEVTVTVKAKTK